MATTKHIRRRALSLGILCFLCLFVAAEPFRLANASLNQANTMACCAGKAAGHCESGIPAKKVPPPKSEPMCGLEAAGPEDDGITIVAEPVESSHSHSQTAETTTSQPAAESASLSRPCNMECGACATSATRQQKRERSLLLASTYQVASLTTSSKYQDNSLFLSSSDNWPQTIPRGPPAGR
ncbi:MAG TPA: hypothetical protein VKB02_15675 [Pyrinomonadaceae bacterium]|nr:hypothetical protein [Pyrinomonadaceae bacterium]